VTSYPGGGISEHCAVADDGYDRIYSLGGYNCYNYTSWSRTYEQCGESSDAYQYRVSNDSWSTFPALRYTSAQIGCAITRRASTGNRLLLVTGNYLKYVQYFDLTAGKSWAVFSYYERYGWGSPKLVAVTPWEVYKMGGYCSGCGYR
jgi:hypothetical protein